MPETKKKPAPKNKPAKPRRIKLVMVNPANFMSLFKTGMRVKKNFEVVKGIPRDATILTISYDAARAAIIVILESEDFDEVPVGDIPPSIPIEIDVKD